MKKSFQDQLSEFAQSRGFSVRKTANQQTTQKYSSKKKSQYKNKAFTARAIRSINDNKKSKVKDVIREIIKQANAGRNGQRCKVNKTVDVSSLIIFIIDCKENGFISEADAYFCLCTIENIKEFPPNQAKEFQQALHNSSLRMQELAAADNLTEEDKKAYLKQLDILKKQQESIKIKHYISLAKEVLSCGLDVDAKISSTPILNEDDFVLSMAWLDNNLKNIINNRVDTVLEKFGKNYEVGRVLSARAAEKAAKMFYERCGFKVEDVSISQMIQNNKCDWKDFDLKVDGFPVDIKNSRRAYSSRERYVEHCVPKFKITRKKEAVKVAGILSRYLFPEQLLAPEEYNIDTSLIFLGETTYDVQVKIINEFQSDFFDIDFGRPDHKANFFLPPWIFNYPPNIYQKRNDAIAQINKPGAIDYVLCQRKDANILPICIVVNINLENYLTHEALKAWQWNLYGKLRNVMSIYGLSLPFLYLTFLRHFTEMLSHHTVQHDDYRPNQYRQFVFMNNERYDKPLGIYDPLYTISSLINVLDKLWFADHGMIKDYKYFKLRGFHIFQGKKSIDDRWETLIAYCGGWIPEKGKCGRYPLVFGDSNRCAICKKLICPTCGFCSEECPNTSKDSLPYSNYMEDHHNRYVSGGHDDIPF